jgi:hypothetical protein
MTALQYEAHGHRLRIAGGYRAQSAANELVAAARGSSGDRGTVGFVRKHGTAPDDVLLAAEHAPA